MQANRKVVIKQEKYYLIQCQHEYGCSITFCIYIIGRIQIGGVNSKVVNPLL